MVLKKVRAQRGSDGNVRLVEVLQPVKEAGGSFDSHMFLYFSTARNMFVYCGHSRNIESCVVPCTELQPKLRLKCRPIYGGLGQASVRRIQSAMAEGEAKSQDESKEGRPEAGANKPDKKNRKRHQERRIGEIINKVKQWRILYTGQPTENGTVGKHTLEEAAEIVGIAKKTLDDYLMQLRYGHKYGFDFNQHKDAKVGILRNFVKKQKREAQDANIPPSASSNQDPGQSSPVTMD